MQFQIDERRCTVAIAPRPLILDAQPVMAKYDPRRRKIWISDQLPKHERRRTLFHELRHFWIDSRGLVNGEEPDAIDAGEMLDTILEQYLSQGGDAVLEAMAPLPETKIPQTPMGLLAFSPPRCGYCDAPSSIGSIGNGVPEWSDDYGVFLMERGVLCEICDRVTLWREQCSADGMPLGTVAPYPPPRVVAGVEAAAWIGDHQTPCRVVSV